MSKIFDGNVSIVLNTKGEIALRRDPEGRFNAENVKECYTTMLRLAKEKKASINKYSLFIADPKGEPVLLANRYGNPYIGLLPKRPEGDAPVVRKVVKLA